MTRQTEAASLALRDGAALQVDRPRRHRGRDLSQNSRRVMFGVPADRSVGMGIRRDVRDVEPTNGRTGDETRRFVRWHVLNSLRYSSGDGRAAEAVAMSR